MNVYNHILKKKKGKKMNQVWCTRLVSALARQRQADLGEFKAVLEYIEFQGRLCREILSQIKEEK